MPRKSISSRTRFAILKRDGFACTYCGARAPQAKLVIDHIEAFARGGADDPSNYTTACTACNASKGVSSVLVDVEPTESRRRFTDEELQLLGWVGKTAFTDIDRFIEIVRAKKSATPFSAGDDLDEWHMRTTLQAMEQMCEEILNSYLERLQRLRDRL